MTTKACDMVKRARVNMTLTDPFFGSLVLRLKPVEDPSCKTAYTDGVHIGYNPAFVESLTQFELEGLLRHEVLHVSNGHCWRRGTRDARQWNEACDHAINHIIVEAGGRLPEGALHAPQFAGMSSERIFGLLPEGGEGAGQPDPNGQPGQPDNSDLDVRDYPEGEEGVPDKVEAEVQWKLAALEAAKTAKMAGKQNGYTERLLEELVRSRVNWRAELLQFAQERARDDYSWRRPSSRYLPRGLYLPHLYSEKLPPMVVAIDTSGSVTADELREFGGVIQDILDLCQPESITVLYCDTRVCGTEVFEQGDKVALRLRGGGGTKFQPVFDYIEAEGIEPCGLIYLTDLYGPNPQDPGDYPTLWVTKSKNKAGAFGRTILLED